ncbi:MAG: DUF502 domain-containing protein [Pseudomonadota bacterium]
MSQHEPHNTQRQSLMGLFGKGLVTIIPIALTLLIVFWLARLAENSFGQMIRWALPDDWYVTGMGLVAGLFVVVLIGLLSQVYLFRKLIDYSEALLARMPLVKSIFQATKDFVGYFGQSGQRGFNQLVMVRHPQGFGIMGFITREDFSDLPFGEPGEVAVYLPLSYQVAGYTIYVPKDWLEPINMPFEDSVRLILTAAMTRKQESDTQSEHGDSSPSAKS